MKRIFCLFVETIEQQLDLLGWLCLSQIHCRQLNLLYEYDSQKITLAITASRDVVGKIEVQTSVNEL